MVQISSRLYHLNRDYEQFCIFRFYMGIGKWRHVAITWRMEYYINYNLYSTPCMTSSCWSFTKALGNVSLRDIVLWCKYEVICIIYNGSYGQYKEVQYYYSPSPPTHHHPLVRKGVSKHRKPLEEETDISLNDRTGSISSVYEFTISWIVRLLWKSV